MRDTYIALALSALLAQAAGPLEFDLAMISPSGGAQNFGTYTNNGLAMVSGGRGLPFVLGWEQEPSSLDRVRWFVNDFAEGSRLMDLEAGNVLDGRLSIAGSVVENHNFDLAESFWAGRRLEPGTVVALDPERPGGVLPATAESAVVGVVSGSPGFWMGGPPLSLERLAEAWGETAVALFELEWARNVADVYDADPAFASERAVVDRKDSHELQRDHQTELFDRVMRLFYGRYVAPVALQGRVPVLVDASVGPIAPGDPLVASALPGVAVRAREEGVTIGIALETLDAGQGELLALIDREWYPGDAAFE